MAVGTQQTLTATAKAGSGTTITDAVFAWTSSNPAVATVDPATGVVNVLTAGTATITATASGISGTAALLSAPPLTSGVAVTAPSIPATNLVLYALVVPAGKTSLTVTTTGGTGDGDLYVFSPTATPGALNTAANAAAALPGFTCQSFNSGNSETCPNSTGAAAMANPAAGVWRVYLFAWGPAGTVTGMSVTATLLP
jgi:hypothetical protein